MDRYEKINLHCKGKVDTMENEKSRRRGKRMKKKEVDYCGGASGMMAANYGGERGDGCDHCRAYGPGGQKDPFHRKWQM